MQKIGIKTNSNNCKINNKEVLILKNSRGFTLIELMITVAIVGILAAVALPAYQDYVARSQVSEGLTLVSGAKPIIAEYYSNHGSYPNANDISFNGYTGSYVGATTIGADGAIVATFSDDAHRQLRGQTVTLTPEEVEETGNLRWNCSSSVASKYLPTSCVNDGNSGNPGGQTPPPIEGGSYFSGLFGIENGQLVYTENGLNNRYDFAYDSSLGQYVVDFAPDDILNDFANQILIDQYGTITFNKPMGSYGLTYNQKYYNDEDRVVTISHPLRDINGQTHNIEVVNFPPTTYTGNTALTNALNQLRINANSVTSNVGQVNGESAYEILYDSTRAQTYNNQLQIVKDLINQGIANGEPLPQSYRDLLNSNSI